MHTRTGWLVMLLTAGATLASAAAARAQSFEVPAADPVFPLPLWHRNAEKGGFFAAGEFVYWRQTNTLKPQVVAVRGFSDTDGSLQIARNALNPFAIDPITGITLTQTVPNPNDPTMTLTIPIPVAPPVPGAFFGSGLPALNTEQLQGPNTYQPGWAMTLGWKFGDNVTMEFSWRHLAESRYNAVASVVPPNYNIGRNGEDQFLFSPVHNFPPEFAGPPNKLGVANPAAVASSSASISISPVFGIASPLFFPFGFFLAFPTAFAINASATQNGVVSVPQAAYGIWNAATTMSIDFVQRYDQYDLVGRIPLYQNDCSRWWVTMGGRHVWFWERFKWRTVSVANLNPGSGATVTLTNGGTPAQILPNGTIIGATPPLFTIAAGAVAGTAPALAGADDVAIYTNIVSNRLYGPTVGCGSEWYLGWGLSFSLDLRASLFVDVVKERARYEREDKAIANKRARQEYTLVPELDAIANIYWYPIEGVELRAGYDFMNFFNTVASPRPVDFNYGALAPVYERGTYRFIDGFHAGIAFIF